MRTEVSDLRPVHRHAATVAIQPELTCTEICQDENRTCPFSCEDDGAIQRVYASEQYCEEKMDVMDATDSCHAPVPDEQGDWVRCCCRV